jgi:hypothetical protein
MAPKVVPYADNPMIPSLELVLNLKCNLLEAIEVGLTPSGLRRVVDILDGVFEGPLLRGTVLPGGADWQVLRHDDVTELQAHYMLRTDDGVLIQVRNRGLRHGPQEVLRRIAEGAPVDPAEYYCRTTPVFEAPAGRYEWLNRSVFTATAARHSRAIEIAMFRVC